MRSPRRGTRSPGGMGLIASCVIIANRTSGCCAGRLFATPIPGRCREPFAARQPFRDRILFPGVSYECVVVGFVMTSRLLSLTWISMPLAGCRVSPMTGAILADGIYLAAWPLAGVLAPFALLVLGLVAGVASVGF